LTDTTDENRVRRVDLDCSPEVMLCLAKLVLPKVGRSHSVPASASENEIKGKSATERTPDATKKRKLLVLTKR